MSEEYVIKFKCPNCLAVFDRKLPKGHSAAGNAGNCPTCGCSENTVVRETGQKLGRFEVIPPALKPEKGKRFELLLEEDGLTIKRK